MKSTLKLWQNLRKNGTIYIFFHFGNTKKTEKGLPEGRKQGERGGPLGEWIGPILMAQRGQWTC